MRSRSSVLAAFACVLSFAPLHAQRMEDLLPKIAAEKNDSARFYLAFSGLTTSETNPSTCTGPRPRALWLPGRLVLKACGKERDRGDGC